MYSNFVDAVPPRYLVFGVCRRPFDSIKFIAVDGPPNIRFCELSFDWHCWISCLHLDIDSMNEWMTRLFIGVNTFEMHEWTGKKTAWFHENEIRGQISITISINSRNFYWMFHTKLCSHIARAVIHFQLLTARSHFMPGDCFIGSNSTEKECKKKNNNFDLVNECLKNN